MFFVIDENNNKIEAYDKEGVLAVLAQAIKDGSLSGITADSAFINKIKCCVTGQTNRIAFVTQAKYNELETNGQTESGVYYYITDDDTLEGINEKLGEIEADIAGLQNNGNNQAEVLLGEGDTPASTVNIDKAGLYAVTIRAGVSTSLLSGVISVPDLTQTTDAYFMLGEVNGVVKECIARYNSLSTKRCLECVCSSDYEMVDAWFTDVRLLIKY